MAHIQKPVNSPKSVLRVDKDIEFVLDEDDVSYLASVPTQKSIDNPRKAYMKKNASTFNPCVSFLEPVIENSNISESKKLTSNIARSPGSYKTKTILRKRKRDPINDAPKRVLTKKLKKNVSTSKMMGKKEESFSPPKSKALKNSPNSSESDVEVVEIKLFKQGNAKAKFINGKKPQNNKNNLLGKGNTRENKLNDEYAKRKPSMKQSPLGALKPCFSPRSEEFINEADTAPIMNIGSIPDRPLNEASCSLVNRSSIKWLSANGTIDFVPYSNESSSESKESHISFADKYNFFVPEIQAPRKNGKKRSNELDKLFAHLNEISWTHERSFKKLLSPKDERHPDRFVNARSETCEKNLRSITGSNVSKCDKNNSPKLKPKIKNKIVKKPLLKIKSPVKCKNSALISKIKKRNLETKNVVKHADKIKKRIYHKIKAKAKRKGISSVTKPKLSSVAKKTAVKSVVKKGPLKVSVVHTKNEKKIKPNTDIKKKIPEIKTKAHNIEKKGKSGVKLKFNNAQKPKLNSIMKEKPLSSKISTKQNSFVNSVPSKKIESSDASGSGVQIVNKKYSATKLGGNSITNNKSSIIKNALKEFEKIEIANEIEIFRSILGGDNGGDIFSALQRGSKLRVTLEPLEHTTHWNSDFYEAFKKQILEQALRKTLEKRNADPINSMFQDLHETIFNPPNNVKVSKKKKPEEESVRSSVRQIEGSFRYKEIVVKKHKNYMQFVLVPNLSKKNCLTIEAMKELKEAFLLAKKDPSCRAVLLNSSGPYFCTGIDLSQLISDHRKQLAEEMAMTIRDLVMAFAMFTKPVIAAVNGTAVGFGVSLLTYCDVVLASDKATFCIPATRLGYLPEGGITLTLPQVVGAGVASEMLLQGRRLTAEQALRHGLVSEVMWPTQLMNEVVPRLQAIVSQPLQVMEATKSMVRCHLWEKLKTHVEKESRLLPPLWLDAQCQHNIKRTLQTGWLVD